MFPFECCARSPSAGPGSMPGRGSVGLPRKANRTRLEPAGRVCYLGGFGVLSLSCTSITSNKMCRRNKNEAFIKSDKTKSRKSAIIGWKQEKKILKSKLIKKMVQDTSRSHDTLS